MSNIAELVDEWLTRIRHDLTPFSDPGTEVSATAEGRSIVARWVMRREPSEAVFVVSTDSGVVVRSNAREQSYASFFASTAMADLVGLAKMILQASPQPVFVDTPAIVQGSEQKEPAPATRLLRKTLTEARGLAATTVVMVTADAGAGKTSVLRELVRQSAHEFISGRSDHVLLYVNAQGRALARLDEALATELSDLRARMTYHAVPTLTRLGLIVPVIDGFDELLGVSGYDEAFSSLARFVEDLNGEGQLVASARSTYYEQEFVSRSNTVSSLGAQIWYQIPIQVLEWGPRQVDEFFDEIVRRESFQDSRAELRRVFKRAFSGANEELEKKPFFVSRVIELAMQGEEFNEQGELLESLVRAYVDRELGKLTGRQGEALLNRGQIISLLREIAEEMWNEESRELDRRTTKDVAEYVLASDSVSDAVQRYVVERMPSMAFLTPGVHSGNVAFEHESFFAYFLGWRLSERLRAEPVQLHTLLGRSAMPEGVADEAARIVVSTYNRDELRRLLSVLSVTAGIESVRSAQVRENTGLLVASLLRFWCRRYSELDDASIEKIVIPGNSLRDVRLRKFRFQDVELRRVDLTRTEFFECEFQRGLLHDVIVDPGFTRLEFRNFDPSAQVLGLRTVTDADIRAEFDPLQIRRILIRCGMKHLAATEAASMHVDKHVLDILDKIVRAYQRSNPISVNREEPRTSVIFQMREWPRVEQLLVESGVVRQESKSTSGAKKIFLRRQVRAEEILAGADPAASVPDSVRRLWKMLAEEFPDSSK